MGQITDRGKKWEMFNSWWIILSFLWFTAPFGFFYIGAKAKKQSWTIVGFVYLIALGILFFGQKAIQAAIGSNYGGILFTLLVIGIVLSFKFKKEYLIRIDMLDKANAKKIEDDNLRERAADGLFQKGIPVQSPNTKQVANLEEEINKGQKEKSGSKSTTKSSPVDINSCSIEELTELPGFSLILAKKAITYRQENNGFTSVDEFCRIVGVKPHFIAQITDKIVCGSTVEQSKPSDSEQIGRKLDL